MKINILPKKKGQKCVIVCTQEGHEYKGIGTFTGKILNWGTLNEPCTVYEFEVKDNNEKPIYMSKEYDVIVRN